MAGSDVMHWEEWVCHSWFSFLVGASGPKDLINTAIQNQYAGLTLTDYDGVYGAARAYRHLRHLTQNNQAGQLKLRYGAEIHLAKDHDLPLTVQDTIIILALTHRGYHHLCKILSDAHRDGKHDPFISIDRLCQYPATDLVAIQPMRGLIRRAGGKDQIFHRRLAQLSDHFHGRFFLVVSRQLNPAEDRYIQPTLEISRQYDLPLLMSQDVYFHHPSQKPMSDLVTAIRHNQVLDAVSGQIFVNDYRCIHSPQVLRALYQDLPIYEQALQTSRDLASQFQFCLGELRYYYPKEWIPTHLTAQTYLEDLTYGAAKRRYGEPLPDKIADLLAHELALVKQLQFADYFLTVYDIVKWARSQDILCQGRGSAANSAICFVLGITAIDPDQYDVLFERFISVERGDPPDIDVDFEHERREEVIQYIYRRYGREKAAMVANVICFKAKGAVRFSGKALGISTDELDQAAKLLRSRAYRGASLAVVLGKVRPGPVGELWAKMASALRGAPRHLGIHSGGFMISQFPITWLCPQEPATMPDRTVIVWCKEDIEGLGFFKIDVLGLGGLTLIKKCLVDLKTHLGVELTLDTIPPDDPETYQMIQQADTVGTFQIESRAQMSFLPRHKPRNFYDLVVEVAIIRPGPIQGGMIHPYLRRRQGQEPVTFPDPRLEPILKRTYGVPIFQEQVMRIAIAVGGFTPGEADELRKNIGVFNLKLDPDLWLNKLVMGMKKNGIQQGFIDQILGHIRGFASYGFPESHAASFALLAYATSYLKCHYPAAFFTAILNAQPMGFYSPDTLLKTAQKKGVKVFPICMAHSGWDHHLERCEEGQVGIRLGFRLVKGLSESAVRQWEEKREDGFWPDLQTFLKNCSLNRVDVTALAAAGAFSVWGIDRKAAIWLAEAVPYSQFLEPIDPVVLFPKETVLESVQLDYQATQTSLGPHPALLMKQFAWMFKIGIEKLVSAASATTPNMANRWVWVFGMVTMRQAPPTAKGMVFVTAWDETGTFNLVIQPPVYARYRHLIDHQAFLCVGGRVQRNQDAYSILVRQVVSPTENMGKIIPLPQSVDYPMDQSNVKRQFGR